MTKKAEPQTWAGARQRERAWAAWRVRGRWGEYFPLERGMFMETRIYGKLSIDTNTIDEKVKAVIYLLEFHLPNI